jgi:hypothetical protein
MQRPAIAAALFLAFRLVHAQEDKDLALLPPTLGAPAESGSTATGKLYLEDVATLASQRSMLAVPLPAAPVENWENRTSLDGRNEFKLDDQLRFSVSDRVSVIEANDIDVPARQNIRNDFREAYLTWEPVAETYVEAGRINVRNGEALGFNPTDFFKARSSVELASLDPTVLRENRLGTVMIRGQSIFDGGSVGLVAAPRLTDATPIDTGLPPSFDPQFGRTNGENRFLLSGRADVTQQFSPEIMLYRSDSETRLGANLSHGIGDAVMAYAEWSGGNEASLSQRAISFGRAVGTVPADAPAPMPPDGGRVWRDQLAAGASITSSALELTVNLEYHLDQSGFTRTDWRNWFSGGPNTLLWYIRAYAADQQEPNSRQQLFLRADATNAFIRDLELSGFAILNPDDGSTLAQLAANYYLSGAWTLGVLASASLGSRHSEHGSVPQAGGAVLQLQRYF